MEKYDNIIQSRNITQVIKRDGTVQKVDIYQARTKVISLINVEPILKYIDLDALITQLCQQIVDKISTYRINSLLQEIAAQMVTYHPDYSTLAARLAVYNLHKRTKDSFSEMLYDLHEAELVSDEIFNVTMKHRDLIDSQIVHQRDYEFDYFGFKTLENSYLFKIDNNIVERPQYLFMRVGLGIHGDNIEKAFETYQMMSQRYFTHATPTLFNAGSRQQQLSSCFLLDIRDDSIDGIYKTLHDCSLISKHSGGIGIAISKIRSRGSQINRGNGRSNGIVPMLKVYDTTASYVDQGGNKRKGSFCIYLEPWHADIFEYLDLKLNTGQEEFRARDLYYALWIPDLFMQRVKDDKQWSLMCPSVSPGLDECWGKDFEKLYIKYEIDNRYVKRVSARELFYKIIETQIKVGMPFMLYKDHCNAKSNHNHMGTLKLSNLCTEIIQYSSKDQTAVCNLASINLQKFLIEKDNNTIIFDYDMLEKVVSIVTENLDKVIDKNYYPTELAKISNMQTRPMGIGVQGFHDMLIRMRLEFESPQAIQMNKLIFERMYYAACKTSVRLAKELGTYPTYEGSLVSRGILQFDMWGVKQEYLKCDWEQLRKDIGLYGLRNSLLMAIMPTASTSQILGNCESIDPYSSNLFKRRVLAGDFIVINKHLVNDLVKRNKWFEIVPNMGVTYRELIFNQLMKYNGCVQQIDEVDEDLKRLYKTSWNMKQKAIMDHSIARAPFIDQSQSLNVYMKNPSLERLFVMHMYAWQNGLKTGMYYLRSQAATEPVKFTLNVELLKQKEQQKQIENKVKQDANSGGCEAKFVCMGEQGCESCSG